MLILYCVAARWGFWSYWSYWVHTDTHAYVALPIHTHSHTYSSLRECLFISIKTSHQQHHRHHRHRHHLPSDLNTLKRKYADLELCLRICVCQARASLNRENWQTCARCLFDFNIFEQERVLVYVLARHTLTLYITAILLQQYGSIFKLHLFIYTYIFIKHITTITGDKNVWTERVYVWALGMGIRMCLFLWMLVIFLCFHFSFFDSFLRHFNSRSLIGTGVSQKKKRTNGRASDSKYRKNTDKLFDAPHCGTQSNKIHVNQFLFIESAGWRALFLNCWFMMWHKSKSEST